jgi:hypothetical protein
MFLHGCLIQQASQRKGHHHRPQYKPHCIETRTTAPNRNKNNRTTTAPHQNKNISASHRNKNERREEIHNKDVDSGVDFTLGSSEEAQDA